MMKKAVNGVCDKRWQRVAPTTNWNDRTKPTTNRVDRTKPTTTRTNKDKPC
jgi:hypothetical protein